MGRKVLALSDMKCIKCLKYLRPKDGNYAKYKFGTVLCLKDSPMDKYDRKGKILLSIESDIEPDVEPEATHKEQVGFLEDNRLEDLPFI